MGDFYDDIEDDLKALDGKDARMGSDIGTDYNTNAALVTQVQTAINALGYTPALATDGKYGPATTAGVKWLQTQKGLAADGIIGDQTLGALGITPPGGTSVSSVTGTVKGAAAAALAAIQSQFATLLSWAASNPQPITQGTGVSPGFAGTRASVVNSYVDWTTPFEGFVPYMYLDRLGYVTGGMGDLMDPVSMALAVPWKNADGSKATAEQITAAWNAVDAARTAAKGTVQPSGPAAAGGGTQGNLTTLRISKSDVQNLVAAKMKQNEAFLVSGFPGFVQAPADAQLALHSMAWAMGPGFSKSWPGFDEAFNKGDYATAAAQSHMQGTGIDRRNDADKLLLTNAAQVVAGKKNPDYLYYISGLESLFANTSTGKLIAWVKQNPIKTGGLVALAMGIGALLASRSGKV